MRKALFVEEIDLDNCREFYNNIEKLKEFGDKCNLRIFQYLYGQEEGKRLWELFVNHANRNIYKLLFTYLTNEQTIVLVGNIISNNDLYKASL